MPQNRYQNTALLRMMSFLRWKSQQSLQYDNARGESSLQNHWSQTNRFIHSFVARHAAHLPMDILIFKLSYCVTWSIWLQLWHAFFFSFFLSRYCYNLLSDYLYSRLLCLGYQFIWVLAYVYRNRDCVTYVWVNNTILGFRKDFQCKDISKL